MSNLIHESNNLTTDAVPDAPRAQIKEDNVPESEQNNDFKECSAETNETEQKKTSSSIPSHSTKPKKRIPSAPHKPTHGNKQYYF